MERKHISRKALGHYGIVLVCAIAVCGLASGVWASSMNLIVNPGFEDTNSDSNFGDGWGSYGSAGFHDFWSGNPHASLFADNQGNWGGVYQLGISGSEGVEYQFDLLDVRIEENAWADFRFGLEYFEGDDSTKIGDTLELIDLSVTGDGLAFTMSGIAPVGTVYIRPIISFDNVQSTADGQENMFVFNTSLTVVPEPASLALLGLGVAVCLRRR